MEVDDRLDPYLGIVAALTFAVVAFFLASGDPLESTVLAHIPTASSTLSVVPNLTFNNLFSESTLPLPFFNTSSSTNAAPATTTPKSLARSPSLKPAPAIPLVPKEENIISEIEADPLTDAAATLRGALVNILCYARGSTHYSISGSGVFIDAKGIILTNAHVGQYFLSDKNALCTIRTGGPATDAYGASLIYLSPSWATANPHLLGTFNPKGTGEFDFAFLGVTGGLSGSPLPKNFPAIPLAISVPELGTPVAIASYGAQYLSSSELRDKLFPTVVFGSVEAWLTFDTDTPDMISLTGSVAAQKGSSGGGVVTKTGTLVGVVTTSILEADLSTRNLNALTAPYVRRQYESETGKSLESLLVTPLSSSIADFEPLRQKLNAIVSPN